MKFAFVKKWLSKFGKVMEPLNCIEINKRSILSNYDTFKKLNSEVSVWPVLKSNAYGHGLKQMAEILKEIDSKYLVVDSYYEALKLWEVKKRPVLLIGTIRPENFAVIDWKYTAIMVQDIPTIEALGRLNKYIKVHLKVNTGMNRQGVEMEEVPKMISLLNKYPKLILEGVFSHLADADNENSKYTNMQIANFKKVIEVVKRENPEVKYFHLGASAGAIKVKEPTINAVRLGLGLYGYNPLNKNDQNYENLKDLKPALTFKSVLTKVFILKKGEALGYGLTYKAKKDTKVGIVPVGYYEGLDRRLSNLGVIKHKNKYLPIIGRICMNMALVDLDTTEAKVFDEVEIISCKSDDKNSVIGMAQVANTIPYEILVHLNESIRRSVA